MTELEILKLRRLARVTVAGQPLTVGRSSRNDLVLPHRAVSRDHCVIEIVDGVTRVLDKGSTRGTRVNGRRVDGTVLADGDRIEIGPFELTVRGTGSAPREGGVSLFDATEQPDDDDPDMIPMEDAATTESAATLMGMPALSSAPKTDPRIAELDRREQRLSEGETRITNEREKLDRRETQLDERHARLEQREQTLAAREADFTLKRQAFEDTERTDAAEKSRLQQTLGEISALVETTRDERDTERRRVETLQAEFDELRGEIASSREQEDAGRERSETVQAELDETRERLDEAERRLAMLDAVGEALHQATQRLVDVQRSLLALETAWTETDEWLAEADAEGRGDSEDAIHHQRQHEAIGEQLAAMTQEREELIAQIVGEVGGLGR